MKLKPQQEHNNMQTLEEKKAKKAAYNKARNATPEAKAARKAYYATPEVKERYKATVAAYGKKRVWTAAEKAARVVRSQSKEYLAVKAAYNATPEGAAKNAAHATRRRASKLQQQPAWADQDAIDFVYFSAQVIKDAFGGVAPHVDHIVPLQGKDVRGLHVAENLQLLSAKANIQKSNK